jgi:hypothetical protein
VEVGKGDDSLLIEVMLSDDKAPTACRRRARGFPAEQIEIVRKWIDGGMKWEPGFTFGKEAYEPPLKPRESRTPPRIDGRDHPVDRIVDAHFAENKIPPPPPIAMPPSSAVSPSTSPAFSRSLRSRCLRRRHRARQTRETHRRRPRPRYRLRRTLAELLERPPAQRLPGHRLHRRRTQARSPLALSGARFPTNPTTNSPANCSPPNKESSGFIDGIQWRGSVNASQTREVQFSQSISQTFLGLNMKCASCHDSFVDRWKLDEAYGLAAIFAEKPIEIARCDKPTGRMAKPAWIFPELGEVDPNAPNRSASNNSPG